MKSNSNNLPRVSLFDSLNQQQLFSCVDREAAEKMTAENNNEMKYNEMKYNEMID